MAFYGHLYVPTCEVSTSRIEGGLLENGGGPLAGSHTLRFTEMSGGRWARKSPGEVLQDGLINVVLNNCTLSQLRLQLQAGETDSDPAPGAETGVGGAFIGAMTYQGIPSAQPEVDWGNDDPRWGMSGTSAAAAGCITPWGPGMRWWAVPARRGGCG